MFTVGYTDHAPGDRFARGREMNHWTLEYFSAGEVEVRTSHGLHACCAPSAMLVPPHTPYTERAGGEGRWTEHYVIFDPLAHWHALLSWPQSECGLGLLRLSYPTIAREVKEVLQMALQIQRSSRINRQALVGNAVEKALLALDEINPARGHAQRDARIEQVLEYIAAQHVQALDLEALARRVYLSPSRFAHLFKMQLRQAPMQYVEQYRLARAAEKLLSSGDSIEQIAAAVGFSNAFHFSTRFRKRFGQSPRSYRLNPKEI
jgi:AraC family transcriptional regulator of arabinose operon